MTSAFDRLAGFPLRRLAFAEVGTPLPKSADEELHPAFQPFLVEDEPPPAVSVWEECRPVRYETARRFKTMSLVLDVGMGETLARLVLPALRLERAADGSLVRFMFSPEMFRRWQQEAVAVPHVGEFVETAGPVKAGRRAYMKGGRVFDPGVELRNAVVAARQAGMPEGEILDAASAAIREEGRLEQHKKVVQRFRDAIVDKLGGVLIARVVQELAERVAVEAEELARDGTLDLGALKLAAIREQVGRGR